MLQLRCILRWWLGSPPDVGEYLGRIILSWYADLPRGGHMEAERPDNLADFLTTAERDALLPSAGCEAAALEGDPEIEVAIDPELAEAHRDACNPCQRRDAGTQGLN